MLKGKLKTSSEHTDNGQSCYNHLWSMKLDYLATISSSSALSKQEAEYTKKDNIIKMRVYFIRLILDS